MTYVPEQGFAFEPDRLDREFDAIRAEFETLRFALVNAVPWKGVFLELDGVTGSDPVIGNSYNVESVSTLGVGLYRVDLLVLTIEGVNVPGNIHPMFTISVPPGNQPADTEVFIAEIAAFDEALGTFDLQIFGAEVPANNKLELIPYSLQTGDRLFFSGNMSLGDIVQTNPLIV